eukprot:CAMPEP_0206382318 /NCGR_PEP_ID=MMETSP0294-20121207/13191_1 /ASSEMBLY_ACC=CAM_ASM_000327 /TAXON_ID=39354 /ORGANISM="Heterosigma akashiwo, Strain CCMP2393" /LENGTH=679 /DNA_ID=CAMNT_0053831981 /DNA_START=95 /DNA_END=2134 /DNA_ORIENTATION=+
MASFTISANPQKEEIVVQHKRTVKLETGSTYEVGRTLGSGATAKVKEGIHVQTFEKVALKIIPKAHILSARHREHVEREVQVLKSFHHPNILNLLESDFDTTYQKKNGKVREVVVLVFELAENQELFDFMMHSEPFDEIQARTYFKALLNAIEYCHSHGVFHRDIKPENLLIGSNYELKLADFGLSAIADFETNLSTHCGTRSYMAPEVLSGLEYKGTKADIWSCGVVLFIMLVGHPPFQVALLKDWWFNAISCGRYDRFWAAHFRTAPALSNDAQGFLNRIFVADPDQRAGLEELKAHTWLQGEVLTPNEMAGQMSRKAQAVRERKEAELQASKIKKKEDEERRKKRLLRHQQHHQVAQTASISQQPPLDGSSRRSSGWAMRGGAVDLFNRPTHRSAPAAAVSLRRAAASLPAQQAAASSPTTAALTPAARAPPLPAHLPARELTYLAAAPACLLAAAAAGAAAGGRLGGRVRKLNAPKFAAELEVASLAAAGSVGGEGGAAAASSRWGGGSSSSWGPSFSSVPPSQGVDNCDGEFPPLPAGAEKWDFTEEPVVVKIRVFEVQGGGGVSALHIQRRRGGMLEFISVRQALIDYCCFATTTGARRDKDMGGLDDITTEGEDDFSEEESDSYLAVNESCCDNFDDDEEDENKYGNNFTGQHLFCAGGGAEAILDEEFDLI